MKQIICFLMLGINLLVAQSPGWESIKSTNIPVQNLLQISSVSNGFGCFVAVHYVNGSLKLYKINVATGNAGQPLYEISSGISEIKLMDDKNILYLTYNQNSVFTTLK